MKVEKDGIVKELHDEFMLADYIQAGWKVAKTSEGRANRIFKSEKEDK